MSDHDQQHPSLGLHEIVTHDAHDHVAAVFPDRSAATATVDELRALGLGSEHLGLAVRGTDVVDFEHDADAELIDDTAEGIKIGAPIGALAGIALAIAAVPGLGTVLGVGGLLAMTGVSALWGALLGGFVGTAAGEPAWEAHQQLLYTALEEGQVLVVVCDHGRRKEIEPVFQRHGGTQLPLTPASHGS
jgi:hypothetical protein